MADQAGAETDVWYRWLLHERQAGDAAAGAAVRADALRYADRVLDAADLHAGMTLLDVGTGEGLVALRAIERVGAGLRVVLTDVSAPLLRHAEARAVERGVAGQCRFMHCAATDLSQLPDASVDVVALRSVLAYVAEKSVALAEFRRVLKPGGCLTMAEPVFRDDALYVCALRRYAERQGEDEGRFMRLMHRWKAAQFPDTEALVAQNPLTNYTERDLVNLAQQAGFAGIQLALHIDVLPMQMSSWESFLGSSPHPLAPSLAQVLAEQFNEGERAFFVPALRAVLESPDATMTERIAYLRAHKPAG